MNTCSIKFLRQAHIGASIRMTKDKNTIPFDNKPMTGLKIENYGPLGFQISHESLPKTIWVEFNQLPLTRLTILNGVIQDEITFVENIVNHKMQLIRTLDTEYIDLIYATKDLETKEDTMLPLTQGIPGHIYKGARCEHGTEMIFLGIWLTKQVSRTSRWSSRDGEKFYLNNNSPKKAFFLSTSTELSRQEERRLEEKFDIGDGRPTTYSNNPEERKNLEHKALMYDERKKKYNQACKDLKVAKPERYKIVEYPVTSKVVKNLIDCYKDVPKFVDKEFNKELIYQSTNQSDGGYYGKKVDQRELIELNDDYNFIDYDFGISNHYYSGGFQYLTESKVDIDTLAFEKINRDFKLTLQSVLYDQRNDNK